MVKCKSTEWTVKSVFLTQTAEQIIAMSATSSRRWHLHKLAIISRSLSSATLKTGVRTMSCSTIRPTSTRRIPFPSTLSKSWSLVIPSPTVWRGIIPGEAASGTGVSQNEFCISRVEKLIFAVPVRAQDYQATFVGPYGGTHGFVDSSAARPSPPLLPGETAITPDVVQGRYLW